MRLFRLAKSNILKHKAESASLVILMLLCTAVLCSSVSSLFDVQDVYGRVSSRLHCMENHFLIEEPYYHAQYDDFLEQHENVTEFRHVDCVAGLTTGYLDETNTENSMYFVFLDRENEEKIEDFAPTSSLTQEEIQNAPHPIYAPFYVQDTMGKKAGDTLTIIYNGQQYPFTIVGFYESTFYCDNVNYIKIVTSDEDLQTLQNRMGKTNLLAFNAKEGTAGEIAGDFSAFIEENTNNGEQMQISTVLYESQKMFCGIYIKVLLGIMSVMALVILVAVLMMIRRRITDDIRGQVVSIGVLEALGYKSSEIMLSYIYEYAILALLGIIPGVLSALAIDGLIYKVGVLMTAHHYTMQIAALPIILLCLALLAFVLLACFIRARMVYKYPPVTALRKGFSDHHFGKDILPLAKTKRNVHLRLALKGVLHNVKESIGISVCIIVAAAAVVFCLILYNLGGDSMTVINAMSGLELADVSVTASDDTDVEKMRNDLLLHPDVERILLTNDNFDWDLQYDYVNPKKPSEKESHLMAPVVYENYDAISAIRLLDGRYPKYDNEVMISKMDAGSFGKNVGDAYVLKIGKVEKEYIVCGIVSTITNRGHNIYLTDAGYRRLKPSYRPRNLDIFLKEGADAENFRYWLGHTYGRSMDDALKGEITGTSMEARLRAIAEKKMAVLMTEYGVGHADYAIEVNGQMISGSSSIFKTKQVISLKSILETQLGGAMKAFAIGAGIFMGIAIVVVMIIMYMIMTALVKTKRSELGIYKGLGYTSKDLRLQLAFQIVPALVLSVILGTFAGLGLVKILTAMIGSVPVDYLLIVLADLLFMLFAFGAAYVGTVKISKISVYELMTE